MALSSFLNIFISFVAVLLRIAFFTLLERKVLGYAQIRKGPNKVGIAGLPQPLADALKLLTKEQSKPTLSNLIPFLITPIISLFLALILWFLIPSSYQTHFFLYGIIFFLCISSLNVYTTLIAGWRSNSKYSLLGALRRIAQTISYEVRMALILLGVLILILSFDINIILNGLGSWIIILIIPSFLTWFATTLAETNRSPFDFAEGESELVSGFNTEYSGGTFTLIFIAEYTNILFIRLLSAILFCGSFSIPFLNNFLLILETTFLAFIFLWVRASFPRIRYDRLINLTWKSFLPFSLGILIFLVPISLFI